MPLGSEVGLGPSDVVLDGDPTSHPQKGGCAPFLGGKLDPRGPTIGFPNLWNMSIVAKWLDGSRWHLAWRWVSVQAILC